MLSISPVKSVQAAKDYFEKDNYYAKDTKEAIAASDWWGKGAEMLGLSGTVDPTVFETLLAGQLPSGQQLGRIAAGRYQHRPGYDCTFSAPKSVSLLSVEDLRILIAHDEAVKEALIYLQAHAIETRHFIKGAIQFEKVDNLIAALFRHGTARAVDDKSLPDPDLHTHCVLMNMVERADKAWRSISSEKLFRHKMCAGMIYRAALAQKLQQLGYDIEKTHADGRFEIAGISREQIEAFSKRRSQITSTLENLGLSGAKAANAVTINTRAQKNNLPATVLKAHWQKEAKVQGLELEKIKLESLARGPIAMSEQEVQAKKAVSFAILHLSQNEAVFGPEALVRHALAHGLGKTTFAAINQTIEQTAKAGILVQCGNGDWTTQVALERERDTIAMMQAGKAQLTSIASQSEVETELENTFLSKEQQQAVLGVLTTTDKYVAINGIAGSGKTTLVCAIKQAAIAQGYSLIGIAPKSSQALTLENESGIPSQNLSLYLTKALYANARGLLADNNKRLIFLDEASLASSDQMHTLLSLLKETSSGTRLVMLGDVKQLPAVEAGAPYGQLIKHGMTTYQMQRTQRQKTAALKESVYHVFNDRVEAAFAKLGNHILEISDREKRLEAMAKEYLAGSASQRQRTLVISPSNRDRLDLNNKIRAGLIAERQLTGEALTTQVLLPRHLTPAQLSETRFYKIGNLVRFNANYKKFGITRGSHYQVTAIEPETQSLKLTHASGQEITWQPALLNKWRKGAVEVYKKDTRELMQGDHISFTRIIDQHHQVVTARTAEVIKLEGQTATIKLGRNRYYQLQLNEHHHQYWDYAFSLTVHAAQGRTADYVVANLDSAQTQLTHQSAFYVTISRARLEAKLYVDNKQAVSDGLSKRTGLKINALEGIESDIDKSTVQPKISKTSQKPYWDFEQIQQNLLPHLTSFATELLGEPNPKHSNAQRLKWGRKGSFELSIKPETAGLWYDYESGAGGNLIQLLQYKKGYDLKQTLAYLQQRFSVPLAKRNAPIAALKKNVTASTEPITLLDKNRIQVAKRLVEESLPIDGTLAETYLKTHRKIQLTTYPSCLRYHPGLEVLGGKQRLPALLVVATNEGKIQAVQAIFLDEQTAQKAKIEVPKLTFGRMKFGATVVLNEGDKNTEPVMVFEGPENGLSGLMVYPNRRIEVTLSVSNFKNVQAKKNQEIIYCIDNDGPNAPSLKALEKAALKQAAQGRDVFIIKPPNRGEDYNDILRKQGKSVLKTVLANSYQFISKDKDISSLGLKQKGQEKTYREMEI